MDTYTCVGGLKAFLPRNVNADTIAQKKKILIAAITTKFGIKNSKRLQKITAIPEKNM